MKKNSICPFFKIGTFQSVILAFIFLMLVSTQTGYSQSKLLNKLIAKVAKKAGAANTVSISSLTDVSPTVGIESNIYPVELGTISQSFFEGWKTGGDIVSISLFSKTNNSFVKIDGTVTIDGQPVNYMVAGSYGLITAPNRAPRKVEITTSTGQKSSFTIEPSKKQVKILSINGQKENIKLDLSKDVVIELENTGLSANDLLKVNIAINQVSIKSLYNVCYIKNAATLTIPAAAFRNINIKPAGSAVYNYKKSFIGVAIETTEAASAVSGSFPSLTYTRAYSDGKLITVSEEPNLNTGLEAKGKDNLKDGEMSYEFNKPNAFSSRPISMLKKIGMLSFSIAGKTFFETSVITQERNIEKGEAQTSKTTTITFPQQTNEVWDGVTAKMFPQLTAIVQAELNAEVLPVDAVQKTAAYKDIESYSRAEVNTASDFHRGYGKTKFLEAVPAGKGLGINGPNERMLNEAKVDALMNVSLTLELHQDGDFGVLVPTLTFELIGKTNGKETETKYYTGTITGRGVPCAEIGLTVEYSSASSTDMKGRNDKKVYNTVGVITPEKLDNLVRRSDILTEFAKALKEIKGKEIANTDYEVVWSLQK